MGSIKYTPQSAAKATIRPRTSSLDSSGAGSVRSVVPTKNKKVSPNRKAATSVIAANSAKISNDKVVKRPSTKSKDVKHNHKPTSTLSKPKANGKYEKTVGDSKTNDAVKQETSSDTDLITEDHKNDKAAFDKNGNQVHRNGRVVGRQLVLWHRPRMMEKLLLNLQYECHRAGIQIPWDRIVHRLHPDSSGFAALQNLNKVRDTLVTEGHMVPPLLGKRTVPQDPTIRGYVRDMTADSASTTRIVRWSEALDNPKESLKVPGVVRGSGNYPRGEAKVVKENSNDGGERRNRLPFELQNGAKPPKKNNRTRSSSGSQVSVRRSPDPAELAPDEDYHPNSKKSRYSRSRAAKKSRTHQDDSSSNGSVADIAESVHETSTTMTRLSASEKSSRSPSSLTVTLFLRPEILENFPPGKSTDIYESDSEQYACDNEVSDTSPIEEDQSTPAQVGDKFQQEVECEFDVDAEYEYDGHKELGNGLYFKNDVAEYNDDAEELGSDSFSNDAVPVYSDAPYHVTPLERYTSSLSYEGIDIHGTLDQYIQALAVGIDPCVNGLRTKRAKANSGSYGNGTKSVVASKVSIMPNYLTGIETDEYYAAGVGLSISSRESSNLSHNLQTHGGNFRGQSSADDIISNDGIIIQRFINRGETIDEQFVAQVNSGCSMYQNGGQMAKTILSGSGSNSVFGQCAGSMPIQNNCYNGTSALHPDTLGDFGCDDDVGNTYTKSVARNSSTSVSTAGNVFTPEESPLSPIISELDLLDDDMLDGDDSDDYWSRSY